ncbi:recombinase family protein [Pseudomonas sp. NPDC007930]|uniref:recombinase family protein n=1 Tax=Pseudomonas sp. NPDC007930 TaxID=3364417 RepID=UPI0036E63505
MPKAYAYVRYSSTAQGMGDTVERQTSPLEDFTLHTGIQITKLFIDEAVSSFRGANARTGKLKDILESIKSGELRRGDYLVVESIDRITRQPVFNGVSLLQDILRTGVKIYTTIGKKEYSDEIKRNGLSTILEIAVIAERAHDESQHKSDRRKYKWDTAKKEAGSGGKIFNKRTPPYGVTYNEVTQKFEVQHEQAAEVRRIFHLLKYMGVSAVITEINKNSLRKWTNKAVSLLLRTKSPLGVLMSQRRDENQKKVFVEFVEGYYPAIITHTEYDEAVAAMQKRKSRKNYGNFTIGNANIFRHVVKCGKCGESLVFEKQKNPKGEMYYYFHCKTKKEYKGDCDQRFRFDLAFGMLASAVAMFNRNSLPMASVTKESVSDEVMVLMKKKHDALWKDRPSGGRFGIRKLVDGESQKAHKVRRLEFGQSLFDMLAARGAQKVRISTEIEIEEEKLAGIRSMRSNLDETMLASAAAHSGYVPAVLVARAAELHSEMDVQVKKVEGLKLQEADMLVTMPIVSVKDLIGKYQTEEGRLELNAFFIKQDLEFVFEYDAKIRALNMNVYKSSEDVFQAERSFTLHKPLADFGIDRISAYCE